MPFFWLKPTSVSSCHRPGLDGYISKVAKFPAKTDFFLFYQLLYTIKIESAKAAKELMNIMMLTRQQWVDSVSVAGALLVDKGLSMEVDTLNIFGRAHVDQVPTRKLVGVHSQAL